MSLRPKFMKKIIFSIISLLLITSFLCACSYKTFDDAVQKQFFNENDKFTDEAGTHYTNAEGRETIIPPTPDSNQIVYKGIGESFEHPNDKDVFFTLDKVETFDSVDDAGVSRDECTDIFDGELDRMGFILLTVTVENNSPSNIVDMSSFSAVPNPEKCTLTETDMPWYVYQSAHPSIEEKRKEYYAANIKSGTKKEVKLGLIAQKDSIEKEALWLTVGTRYDNRYFELFGDKAK